MKVVTIGAGSSYTPELCEGLLKRYSKLNIKEWWLVDVEEGQEKLDIIYDLVLRMVKKTGHPMKVFKTLNRREAVKDADFITTQLRVGLLEAREKDEYIPLSHGMIGQETNGAGGLFKGLRTIPVILDIVKDVQELAKPNAWIINFTNPAGMVTEAVHKLTNFKNFLGVCNVPIDTKMQVSKFSNIPLEDLSYDNAGLNHLSYYTAFYNKGKNITPELLEQYIKVSGDISMKNITAFAWEPDFIRQLNAVPCSYHRYYYKTQTMLHEELEQFKTKTVRATVVREVEKKLFEKYKDVNLDVKPEELQQRGGAYYSDVACGVLTAIHTNSGEEFSVNTVNNGFIGNLPKDWVVETSAKITNKGAVPTGRVNNLPEVAMGLVYNIKEGEFAIINAVKNKKLRQAYIALAINPLSTDDKISKIVFDELVNAHKKYLTYYDDLSELTNE